MLVLWSNMTALNLPPGIWAFYSMLGVFQFFLPDSFAHGRKFELGSLGACLFFRSVRRLTVLKGIWRMKFCLGSGIPANMGFSTFPLEILMDRFGCFHGYGKTYIH